MNLEWDWQFPAFSCTVQHFTHMLKPSSSHRIRSNRIWWSGDSWTPSILHLGSWPAVADRVVSVFLDCRWPRCDLQPWLAIDHRPLIAERWVLSVDTSWSRCFEWDGQCEKRALKMVLALNINGPRKLFRYQSLHSSIPTTFALLTSEFLK